MPPSASRVAEVIAVAAELGAAALVDEREVPADGSLRDLPVGRLHGRGGARRRGEAHEAGTSAGDGKSGQADRQSARAHRETHPAAPSGPPQRSGGVRGETPGCGCVGHGGLDRPAAGDPPVAIVTRAQRLTRRAAVARMCVERPFHDVRWRPRPVPSRSTARRSCSSASSRPRSRRQSASSRRAPDCRRARPRGSSRPWRDRGSSSASATAGGCGPGPSCSATRTATAAGDARRARGARAAPPRRRVAARRSTSPCPGPTGSSISRRRTPRTSSASTDWVGRRVPFELAANGKVLPRLRPRRAADARSCTRIRARGYATSVDELELGLSALAAPVFGPGGEALAALSISGPTARLTSERIAQLAPLLMEEATRLAERLGHRDHARGAA